MKVASAIMKREDSHGLEGYMILMEQIGSGLSHCYESSVDVVVFAALLGSLHSQGERYIIDIAELSKKYTGMAICPGSFYEADSGNRYHSSCIILNGNILLKQRQIYLNRWERTNGLSRGVKLETITIGGLKTGIIVSTDVFYPQVSRAFAMNGAELVLSPVAVVGRDNSIRQLSGLWQNVQSNLFFGVESGFKGRCEGKEYHSRSIIHAPLEMTEKQDGYLAMEATDAKYDIIIAELDNGKRKEAVKKFNTLAQLNIDAYSSIFSAQESGGSHE